ncbi:type III-A CRISPR-associated protein Cas10/Csm1 [Nostoc sp. PCC 7107]|uniref:type III-A CRISPR-associated protein Cas10/Csm1 n=1 Tax=Nostoc sp. PCC 7107 TaxID=317936 RepID=UPI00029F3311|nr:type III-A CRISPR-associated protein Cas10/Csm1 [Nostoc sp. PCC 7107]AFY44833.1 CRISPR-associated protein, Csm1 family [Nostoc sp. PCC 7107]
MVTSSQVALQVIQQAIAALAKWADLAHPSLDHEYKEVTRAKTILGWKEDTKVEILRLLFDSIKLPDGQGQEPGKQHYHQLVAIEKGNQGYPKIPYPLPYKPNEEQQKIFKQQIHNEILNALPNNWENLSYLLAILERFGSCLSFSAFDVCLVDMARSTAAVAAALVSHENVDNISLIAGDISGIQKFIYTISSDGALKSLRARSFYLELVIQEVVQQLLEDLKLPKTNIIYASGGNFYLIASSNLQDVKESINKVSQKFNRWLLNTFKGKLFLAIDCISIPTKDLEDNHFAHYWTKLTKDLANQKARKFNKEINFFIQETRSHEPCRVCHRDDLPSLQPLIHLNPDSSPACWVCRTMFELGNNLFDVNILLRSKRANIKEHVGRVYIPGYYYYFFTNWEQAVKLARNNETVFLVNDWDLNHYKQDKTLLLSLGNYAKESEVEVGRFIRAEEMAKVAEKSGAIPRVGYLRMDVDRLGRLFAEGFDEKNRTLPRIAGLSRQMSYFFKVYLNSLADNRDDNFIKHCQSKNTEVLNNAKYLTDRTRKNLLFIYAAGDDLFISGAWNELVEFTFDIYQCFRAYTGNNPDITISGGISINDIKYPLYQAAADSEKSEKGAKENGKDSFGLFNQIFKWDEWLGTAKITSFDQENQKYINPETKPDMLGILPFVERLEQQNIGVNHSRNFVRNLLITAQIQERALEKFQDDQKSQEALDTRYYLHLPKIAYTLARLPKEVLKDDAFRKSLKNPYNAPYFRAIATWIEFLNRS